MVAGEIPKPAGYIDVFGDRIVSSGGCGADLTASPLCLYDLQTPGTYTEIAPHQYGTFNSVWGDIVVWTTGLAADGDIRGYDFSSGSFVEITDDPPTQLSPRIHGDRVVYMDLQFGSGDPTGTWDHATVFVHDLSTQETTKVTNSAWIASFPDIHDNIVVWSDYRDSVDPNDIESFAGVQIWGYNIDTGAEFQITDIPGRAVKSARIWGSKVFVDMSKATGGNAIYAFDLPDGAQ